ncbi:RICIN domain-containing protein [Streptomyces sp. P9(2023)]|uniref:RICIN domain-containing protein n=1 Tax=Streptomyces sp. P9(2023) TaxID=3064394 RepID=UPI0037DCD738
MLRFPRTPGAVRRSAHRARITRPWVAACVVAASAASALTAVQPSQAVPVQAAVQKSAPKMAAALPSDWSTVVNSAGGKCLDARSAATANGTAVQQYACQKKREWLRQKP